MLKTMCSQPPCMNIEVKIVRKAGGWFRSSIGTPACRASRYSGVPSQTSLLRSPDVGRRCRHRRSHSSPGWVIRYGIAPYSTTVLVSTLSPLDNENDGPWRNRNTSTLIAMNTSVTTGKRSVGMLSRSGIKGPEA